MGSRETSACSWPGPQPDPDAAPKVGHRPFPRIVTIGADRTAVHSAVPRARHCRARFFTLVTFHGFFATSRMQRRHDDEPDPGADRSKSIPLSIVPRDGSLPLGKLREVISGTYGARPVHCRPIPAALPDGNQGAGMAKACARAARHGPSETRQRQPSVSHHHRAGALCVCDLVPLEQPYQARTALAERVRGQKRTVAARGTAGMKKKQVKLPIVDRLYTRAVPRWSSDREEAVRYLLAAAETLDHATRQKLIARLPLPLAQRVREGFAATT
jgi:hypothetical protein